MEEAKCEERESGRERGPRKAEQASERSKDEGRLTRKEGQAAVRGWFQSESAVAATAGCLTDCVMKTETCATSAPSRATPTPRCDLTTSVGHGPEAAEAARGKAAAVTAGPVRRGEGSARG